MDNHLLSILIWLPIIAGIIVLATGGDNRADLARKLSLGFSIVIFILSIPLYTQFDSSTAQMQFTEHQSWVSYFNIFYSMIISVINGCP